jgi:hypothetical protein
MNKFPSIDFLSIPKLIEHHPMKTYGEWRYSSTHSLTCALEVSSLFHTPAALSPPPLNMRLSGPQMRSGHNGEKNLLPVPTIEP